MVRWLPNQRWSLVILALILGNQLYCIGNAQTQSRIDSISPFGSVGSVDSFGSTTDTRSDQEFVPGWPYVFDSSGFHF